MSDIYESSTKPDKPKPSGATGEIGSEITEAAEVPTPKEKISPRAVSSMKGEVEPESSPPAPKDAGEGFTRREIPQQEVQAKLGRNSLWHDDSGNEIQPLGKDGRGRDFEKLTGAYPGNNFKTIDDFKPETGVATSDKTINLNDPSYRDSPGKVTEKMKSYVDDLANFNGASSVQNGELFSVSRRQIRERVLEVGIPKGTLIGEQEQAFETVANYAKGRRNPCKLVVTEVP